MMTTRSAALALCLLALGGACDGDADREPGSQADPPNLVIITLDTLRADHLGSYGHFRDTTPALDDLAAESLVFERCVAPISCTLPSHTSLFTASSPTEHGVFTNFDFGAQPRWAQYGLRSFAQRALDAGMQTAAVVSAAPVKKGTGLELGFQHFDQPDAPERVAAETTDAALAWLSQRRDSSYLLWVHYFDPHQPLNAPADYTDFGGDAAERDAELARRGVPDQGFELPDRRTLSSGELLDAYDAEVRYMDAQIGRLFDALRADPAWDSTVVVVVGDHGEGVGQHQVVEHFELWWEQVHVPLIMRVPGAKPERVGALMGIADVLPTLAGRLGHPGLAFGDAVSGRDVLDSSAEARAELISAPRHGLETFPYTCSLITPTAQLMLPRPGHVLDAPRLFDLQADPAQLRDLAAERPEQVALLLAVVEPRCAALHRSAEAMGSAAEQTEAMRRLSEELRALGYVE